MEENIMMITDGKKVIKNNDRLMPGDVLIWFTTKPLVAVTRPSLILEEKTTGHRLSFDGDDHDGFHLLCKIGSIGAFVSLCTLLARSAGLSGETKFVDGYSDRVVAVELL